MVQFLGVRSIINPCHRAVDDESTKRRTDKVTIFEAFLQKYQNVGLQKLASLLVRNQWSTSYQYDGIIQKCKHEKCKERFQYISSFNHYCITIRIFAAFTLHVSRIVTQAHQTTYCTVRLAASIREVPYSNLD
jgi:hypothetical protein